jgi:hypothetical protein
VRTGRLARTTGGQVIDVDCFAPTGFLVNRTFTVTYASAGNLMGRGGLTTANAYANKSTAGVYQPSGQYNSVRGARVTVARPRTGEYLLLLAGSEGPGSINGGDIQVTTVGSLDQHCYVPGWSQQFTPEVTVLCVNGLGNPINARFTIQWVVAWPAWRDLG